MSLLPGNAGTFVQEVEETHTATSLGSGDVDVLGTPAVVAFCERAAVLAVSEDLDDGQTTVGTRVDIEHRAPTIVGREVIAHARLDNVEGRQLTFTVWALDPSGEIARGTHTRVIVDRSRFMNSAEQR
jgi:fluoroacetyl-CoA thioesterase